MLISRRYQRYLLICVFLWILLFLAVQFSARWSLSRVPSSQGTAQEDRDPESPARRPKANAKEKELVVASLARDDTSWLEDFFPDWTKNIYVVDNASAPLTVPKNKGREAMPFLTYIIDRYATLPEVSIFIHSLRYQWHNEDPMYDGVPVLKNLQLPYIQRRGFSALRCSWTMGCPAELHPTQPSPTGKDDRSQNERAYASVFSLFFPDLPIPDVVGAHCSSQFAVSRTRIRERPRKFYEGVRGWLLETELEDQISGRVIEYMWHVIFGMGSVDCEDAGRCFCGLLGLCGLRCDEKGSCEGRYRLPRFSTIPGGWPEVGPGTDGWPERDWWVKGGG